MMKSTNLRKLGEALRTAHLMGVGHLLSLIPGRAPTRNVQDVARFVEPQEDDRSETARAAVQRERARCQTIIFSPAAAAHPALAKALAFNTRMTRQEALRTLANISATKDFAHLEGLGRQIQQVIRVH